MCHYTGGVVGVLNPSAPGALPPLLRGGAACARTRQPPTNSLDRDSWVVSLQIGNLVGIRDAYRSNHTTPTGFLTIFTKIVGGGTLFYFSDKLR